MSRFFDTSLRPKTWFFASVYIYRGLGERIKVRVYASTQREKSLWTLRWLTPRLGIIRNLNIGYQVALIS